MDIEITKEEAIGMYRTVSRLADALRITRQAIYLWKDGEPIPEYYALKLRFVLKPELFEKTTKKAG